MPRSQGSNFEGHHFYVGFMRNEIEANRGLSLPHLNIFIAASTASIITIRFPWQETGDVYAIKGDSILTIDIPSNDVYVIESKDSEVPRYTIIEITSDRKVAVSAMSSFYLSSDAYCVLPVPNWGKEYVIMAYANDEYERSDVRVDTMPRTGEFLIMAAEDSTLVQFTPRVRTMKHDSAEFISVYLMKGQSYLVQSSDSIGKGYGDLTGTIVRSDKPIGVLSGHVRTALPIFENLPRGLFASKDCLIEMLLPTKIWGKKYATSPFAIYNDGDLIRIACIEPNTTFIAQGSANSQTVTLKDPGDWVEFYPVGQSISWTSDKPISIVQYMPASYYPDQEFDPAMVVIPPIEQYVSRALIQIQPNPEWKYDKYSSHFVNVICEPKAVSTLQLDGTPVVVNNPKLATQKISGMNLNYVVIPLQPGVHNLTCDSGTFAGIVYGVGPDDSYAYPLGLSLYKPIDTAPPMFTFSEDCSRIKVIAKEAITDTIVGIEYVSVVTDSTTNFKWTIENSTDTSLSIQVDAEPIDITRDGVILIETRDKLGNGRQLKYKYSALSIEVRSNILFQPVNWLDSVCERVVVRNNGTDTIKFSGSMITGDNRVNFSSGIPLIQKSLTPGDSVVFMVCFKPNGDSASLIANLALQLLCNRQINIPITGLVAAPSLAVLGWDFGKVLVGDTACSVGWIINNGNSPLLIRSLTIEPYEPSLALDTAGLFPRLMIPGDSLKIPVCFIPDAVRTFTRNGLAVNNFNLPDNSLTVTGEGVAPLVQSVSFDWQKERTETRHDSTVMFVNYGNYDAVVNLVSASGDTSVLNSRTEFSLPKNLRPIIDTLRLPIKFLPATTQKYRSNYTLEVSNWKLHKPVTLTLDGEGTQPTRATINVDFDTIAFRTFKDSTAIVIKSGGNEALTIDTLILASGDISSFEIDKKYLAGRKLQPNTNDTLPIHFIPSRLGLHTAEILVINDALPAFMRDTALIVLKGFAINLDTVQYSLGMTAPQTIFACTVDTIDIVLKNTGNQPLNFQSIAVSSAINMSVVPVGNLAPQVIDSGKSLTGRFSVEMEKGLVGTVEFKAMCNDTIIETISETISSKNNPLTLSPHPDTTVAPGGIMDILFNGVIDVRQSMPFLLRLSAELNFQTLVLMGKAGTIEFADARQTRTVPAEFNQERGSVTVRATQEISIDTLTTWRVIVPFYIMLSDSSDISIPVHVSDTLHECFSESTTERRIHLSPVCADLIRRVKEANAAFELVSVTPSPIGEAGEARCVIQGDGVVTLEAINQLGERFVLASEKLNIGEYILRFSTKNLSDGVYGIVLRAADGRERRSVIVISR